MEIQIETSGTEAVHTRVKRTVRGKSKESVGIC